jgi:hypothetical protein
VHQRTDGRRDENGLGRAGAEEHRVALRLVEIAERREEEIVVDHLHLTPADEVRHAELVDRAHFEEVHTVLEARRVDVRDPAAEHRRRVVGIRRRDVGPRVAVHRALQDAAVHQHFHARHAVGVGGPAGDRE